MKKLYKVVETYNDGSSDVFMGEIQIREHTVVVADSKRGVIEVPGKRLTSISVIPKTSCLPKASNLS